MITREYIEQKSILFVRQLEDEVRRTPGYRPAEIQLRAAKALLAASMTPNPDFQELLAILAAAKKIGTLGFEMWNFGEQLAKRGPDSLPPE